MFQINVVLCSRIPLVVFKDGPIHFGMNLNELCFPVRTQITVIVFSFHTPKLIWKLSDAKQKLNLLLSVFMYLIWPLCRASVRAFR